MRGVRRSGTGVATSAVYSCVAPKPTRGATATNRTTIPIPPVHCVMLRQRRSEGARSSGASTVEAPVVVKPAIDSKKASTGPITPEKTNGDAPKVATPSHPSTTMRNTSCLKVRTLGLRVRKNRTTPKAIAVIAGPAKASALPSSATKEKAAGMSIAAPPAAMTAPRALAITLGCKEALYLVNRVLHGEHDGVVPRPEHVPAGGDDDLPVPQQRPDDGPLGEPDLGERAASDPASLGDAQLYHLGPALQQGNVDYLSAAHEPEYGFGRQDARGDSQVHAQGVGQRRELAAAHPRDSEPGPELAGVHRGEEVRPIVAGYRDEGVGLVYPLLQEEVAGDPLVVQDETPSELRSDVPGARLVSLDNPYRHAGPLQRQGQPQPDPASAVDRHLSHRRRVGGYGPDHLGDALPAAYEQDVIAPLEHRVPSRYERLPAPHHPDH